MEYESKVGAPLMDMPAKEHWQVYEHLANPPPHSKCCALETLQGQLAGTPGMAASISLCQTGPIVMYSSDDVDDSSVLHIVTQAQMWRQKMRQQ